MFKENIVLFCNLHCVYKHNFLTLVLMYESQKLYMAVSYLPSPNTYFISWSILMWFLAGYMATVNEDYTPLQLVVALWLCLFNVMLRDMMRLECKEKHLMRAFGNIP